VPRTIAEDWWIVRTLGQQRYLLLSLLALLILFPIVAREGPDRFLWYTLMTLIVITGPISLASSRLAMLTGIFFALMVYIPGWITVLGDEAPIAFWITSISASLFFGHLGILIFGQHLGFRNHEVSSDTILAAVNAYLCMGLTFAFAYFSVNLALPDSFSGTFMDSPLRDQVEGFIYFSFVTMTTLGYGDISPVTPTAAVLAYMQAVAGQLYMAVTIARVVGMYVAHRAGQNAP
jgi:hypothetical protein